MTGVQSSAPPTSSSSSSPPPPSSSSSAAAPSSSSSSSSSSSHKINEEFKIWKKNCPFLYDIVVTHALEWPALTVDWLPHPITFSGGGEDDAADPGGKTAVHQIVLGTHCAAGEPNAMLLANVTLPTAGAGWDDVQGGNGASPRFG